MGHTSDTLKRILDHKAVCPIEETYPDISVFYFCCDTRDDAEALWLVFCVAMSGADISRVTRSSLTISYMAGVPQTLLSESGII